MCKTSNIVKKWLAFSSIIVGLGFAGNAAANGCVSLEATFTSSIGSTSSCAGFTGTDGAPMDGVVLGSGETSRTYNGTDCEFQVDVPAGVGQSADNATTFEISDPFPANQKPRCQVKTSIFQGNQGANYCVGFYRAGTSGDTMKTLGNKGDPVPHKQAEFCTDEVADVVSTPVISLEKKVVRVVDNDGDDDIDLDDLVYDPSDPDSIDFYAIATDQIDVIAPSKVVYYFTIRNDGEGTADVVTLSDPLVLSADLDLGSLAGGQEIIENSDLIDITDASEVGEFVNLASVTSIYDGNSDGVPDPCTTCADNDTATLNVVVECDAGTQAQANITGAVVETRTAQGISRCAPKGDITAGETDSVGLLCDGSCELRDECGGVSGKASDCAQPCKPSRNWTYGQNDTVNGGISGSCTFAEPSPGNLALCQEILGNPGNNVASCENNNKPTMIRSDGHSITFGSNPILYYFPPGSLGGNSVGITYCILEPGDTASDCPSGSYVY